ncbi:L-threonylcarbamoyladenylate synthase [Coralloluteibacterium thermophilus]|uniref:L-threonylcarbamoyladenylate synthase n=1 Tax=Coralloluteibacterium thermophilum TaxID=2707049 RepID=A0ABV9NP25_9GAMM
MSDRLEIHPVNPQPRLIEQAAGRIRDGGLALCPTDAGYTLVWALEARDAEERVQRLRALDTKHPFTLLCSAMSEAGRLARLDNRTFQLFRSLTPGPCTFILPASPELPRRLKQTKRRTIGIRIPDFRVTQALIAAVREPLLSTTAALPDDEDVPSHDAEAMSERWLRHVDLMLDAGDCPPGPTSIIDASGKEPQVVRQGFAPLPL